MKKFITVIGIVLMLGLLGYCGKSKQEKQAEKVRQQLENRMEKAQKGLQEMAKNMQEAAKSEKAKVELADFRVLKEALPEVEEWKKSNAKGEKMSSAGFSYSTASATYTMGDYTVEVNLTDTAGIKAMLMPVMTLINMGVESETENGYQKVIKEGDFVGVEEFDGGSKEGNLAMVYRNRYLITIKGYGLKDPKEMGILKEFLKKIDLSKLQ